MVSPAWAAFWSAAGDTSAVLWTTTFGAGAADTSNVEGVLDGLV
jgi:hypothetical protein